MVLYTFSRAMILIYKFSRHAVVVERASKLLKHDQKKLDTFRRYVSEYRTGVQTARETCDLVYLTCECCRVMLMLVASFGVSLIQIQMTLVS